jgi:Zn finger protein HypA/HybF involved in hydrogenase expression
MKKESSSKCPNCGFDFGKLKQQLEMIDCPKCGQSCADISNADYNFIRVIDGLIPREPKDNSKENGGQSN